VIGIIVLVTAGSPAPLLAEAGQIVVGAVVLGGSWTIGRAVRERRRSAQRSAAQLVEHAVAEERLRIARDLHDIVAHGLSLIVVRAATANHVIASRPTEARAALEVIETTGRDALADMRRMLDVLRGDGQEDAVDLAPIPSLDQLPVLVERVAMAGVRVDCDVSGAEALSDGVAVAIYRIVQEALTNVVKHAAPTRCRLRIAVVNEDVQIEVTDEGMRAALDGPGQRVGRGLVGMQERVRTLGGVLEAGPLPHGGFRVWARFPSGSTKGATVSA
jgi:signal transduction histidine kinase